MKIISTSSRSLQLVSKILEGSFRREQDIQSAKDFLMEIIHIPFRFI